MSRSSKIRRETAETEIELRLNLDGSGHAVVDTGVGFLDHMLTLFAVHSLCDLQVEANGDTHIDDHHTVEDVGICLGMAIREAIGNKAGIARYGHMTLPMDETLVTVALDLSDRPLMVFNADFPTEKIGEFDTQLVQEFWQAVVSNARMNFHAVLHHGTNSHHISEAIFKAAARAIRMAVTHDPRRIGVPSSKNAL
ncbi:MAG: imidazoleglycerol-phosphate dehydratase HisB [Planctomycetaceae bacterium]